MKKSDLRELLQAQALERKLKAQKRRRNPDDSELVEDAAGQREMTFSRRHKQAGHRVAESESDSSRSPSPIPREQYEEERQRSPPAMSGQEIEEIRLQELYRRDLCTVRVLNLDEELTEDDLYKYFNRCYPGHITDVRIPVNSKGYSKEIGFVSFDDMDIALRAVAVTGSRIGNRTVSVKSLEVNMDKLRQNRSKAVVSATARIHVSDLPLEVRTRDLRKIFGCFGEITEVALHRGQASSWAYIQYTNPYDASNAVKSLHQIKFMDDAIQVELVEQHDLLVASEKTSDLLDEGKGGVALGDIGRISLTARLSGRAMPEMPVAQMTEHGVVVSNPKTAPITPCVLLTNAFDPRGEQEDNWDKELAADICEECQRSYAMPIHWHVDTNSDDGRIYLRFPTRQCAAEAVKGLDRRWYGGRLLTADHLPTSIYDSRFPVQTMRTLLDLSKDAPLPDSANPVIIPEDASYV